MTNYAYVNGSDEVVALESTQRSSHPGLTEVETELNFHPHRQNWTYTEGGGFVNNGNVVVLEEINEDDLINNKHEFNKQQNIAQSTLTDAANISWNLDDQQNAVITLAGNRTLDNPTNQVAGGTYILIVKQDATGSRTLVYDTSYKWPGGTAPTLSTDANAIDVLCFISDGTNMLGNFNGGFS